MSTWIHLSILIFNTLPQPSLSCSTACTHSPNTPTHFPKATWAPVRVYYYLCFWDLSSSFLVLCLGILFSLCFHSPRNLEENLLIILRLISKTLNRYSASHELLASRKKCSPLVPMTPCVSLYVNICHMGFLFVHVCACMYVYACVPCYIRSS